MKLWGFSPGFWPRQEKVVVVMGCLIVCGHVASKNIERKFDTEEGINQETKIWDALDEIQGQIHNAIPKSIQVGKTGGNPLDTCIRFRSRHGGQFAFYEDTGKLYEERNGEKRLLSDDLLSAFFSFPRRGHDSIQIELQSWKGGTATEELGIALAAGHATFSPAAEAKRSREGRIVPSRS